MIDQSDFDRLKQEAQIKLAELLKQFEGEPNLSGLHGLICATASEFLKNQPSIVQPKLTPIRFDAERGTLHFVLQEREDFGNP